MRIQNAVVFKSLNCQHYYCTCKVEHIVTFLDRNQSRAILR